MDKNFYYQNRAREHQAEISKPLLTRKQAKRLIFRLATAMIITTILLSIFG